MRPALLVGTRRPVRRLGRTLLLGVVVTLTGCSPGYVLRAGYEEAKILWRREPFERALARGDLDDGERRKINAVLAAREFARGLGFNVGGSFASLSYVDGDTTLFVLTAAPRAALRPHTWWFPIVGEVPYKGFFDRARADAEVVALEKQGFDTAIRTAAAFSTLGWFDDPLLRHLLRHDEGFLVDLVLHELYHNTFYVAGQTAFNESLATFVGHRAAIAFFAGRPGEEAFARRAETVWAETLRFGTFIQGLADRLQAVYTAAPDEAAALATRADVFAAARAEFTALGFAEGGFRGFLAVPLNNAVLLHYLLYATGLDTFESIYRAQGDLRRALTVIEGAVRGAEAEPLAAIRRVSGAAPPVVESVAPFDPDPKSAP